MTPGWRIDERRHAGEEHLDRAAVARYDEKNPFDPSREIDHLLALGLSAGDTVVEFGTGTDVFALAIAEHCDHVLAIDVSEPMVAVVREKLEANGVHNVEVVQAGLVNYDQVGAPASFVFSKNALHHRRISGRSKRSKMASALIGLPIARD